MVVAVGEAKRRRLNAEPMVYHHTSTVFTNLLWMDGEIRIEGNKKDAIHPALGRVQTDPRFRRAMKDFPPVAWFTTRMDVPRCLIQTHLVFVKDGAKHTIPLDVEFANAVALNRVALGFRISDVPVVPWPEHPGFETSEGRELNETALDAGDDPTDWYVSEQAIDLMAMCEIRVSKSIMKPKLVRSDRYLLEAKRLVAICRETPGVFIPPSWLKPHEAQQLARSLGVPIKDS